MIAIFLTMINHYTSLIQYTHPANKVFLCGNDTSINDESNDDNLKTVMVMTMVSRVLLIKRNLLRKSERA